MGGNLQNVKLKINMTWHNDWEECDCKKSVAVYSRAREHECACKQLGKKTSDSYLFWVLTVTMRYSALMKKRARRKTTRFGHVPPSSERGGVPFCMTLFLLPGINVITIICT